MKINQIYVNLPVKDVQKTKEFWTQLGFSVNDQMSNEKSVCVVMKEGQIYVMFLTEESFQTFSERPVPNGDTTQVLVAISLDSRAEVDQVVNAALENGATQHEEPQDYGWMYHNSFWDINGHGWNVMFADSSQMPAE
ncbi:glyoxalase/bleomycin resistance/extradiol dioxygenase family protein [Chryseobacterium carnipullorum]|uniref:Glyoxalase/bleomycin resistance/extradiol dioxygenase family protein n=1 Tax=Chryseobacterium carnipullorum TaxID=1124835 RepID=A0A376DVH5_CHRCU|nr:VOC family protein [Chryseobacterium carnipullorum]AZA49682.1 glyoxalase/bleomycin resistance/extradiol dioxygenase family protein [Chryseobacterium carnipullorum]AZA64574.1 glyoxalase/bleomycin resistance/extradiol dioxygenase family protein [Chryseobacterium carnipullorum]STC95233.1 Predicted lactoylglutathione lyase [Chryseobacterium carnipullorum]